MNLRSIFHYVFLFSVTLLCICILLCDVCFNFSYIEYILFEFFYKLYILYSCCIFCKFTKCVVKDNYTAKMSDQDLRFMLEFSL